MLSKLRLLSISAPFSCGFGNTKDLFHYHFPDENIFLEIPIDFLPTSQKTNIDTEYDTMYNKYRRNVSCLSGINYY